MLTGRRPFEADSAAGVALKRLNEDPPPPESIVPVPSGLSAIVMRALQREPADRFPDAGSFAEALRTWQKDPSAGAALAASAGVAGAAVAAAAAAAVGRADRLRPAAGGHAVGSDPAAAAGAATPEEDEGQPWWVWALLVLGVLLLGLIGYLGTQVLGGLGPDATPSPTPSRSRCPTTRGSRSPPCAPTSTALGWCRERGTRAVRRVRPQPGHPDRSGGGQPGERGRHRHGGHQQRRRHGGRPEPDRADPGRGDRDPERGRPAAGPGDAGALGPGGRDRDPQRSAGRHGRRAGIRR